MLAGPWAATLHMELAEGPDPAAALQGSAGWSPCQGDSC